MLESLERKFGGVEKGIGSVKTKKERKRRKNNLDIINLKVLLLFRND